MTQINNIKKTIKLIFSDMSDPFYQGIAAELAYFFLLSLIPIGMVLGQLSGFFSISMDVLVEIIQTYTPSEFANLVIPYLIYPKTSGFSIVFLIFSLYLASRGMFALIRVSNYAYDAKPHRFSYLRQHVKAALLTFGMLFLILFALIVIVFGETLGNALTALFLNMNIPFAISSIWYSLRWPISFAVYFIIVALMYSAMPLGGVHPKRVIPGTIFTTIGIIISSFGFMFYVSKVANYGILYGALSNIVVLLLWFYLIGFILVMGIQINVAFEARDKQISQK